MPNRLSSSKYHNFRDRQVKANRKVFSTFLYFLFLSLASSFVPPSSFLSPAFTQSTNTHNRINTESRTIITPKLNKKMASEKAPLVAKSQNNGAITKRSSAGDDIHQVIASMRQSMQETHDSRQNFSIAWRKDQLTRLKTMVTDHWEDILTALNEDLGKVRAEAAVFEMAAFASEIDYLLANVANFMKPRNVPSPGSIVPAISTLTPMPLKGPAVLVIGPSNYPISISLMATAGSLAGGNPTVLKPSELCPASAKLLGRLVPAYLEPHVLQVVEGGVTETTALLEQEWGIIHFTGSERVGKIVAQAAAKTLTPVVLELGGKGPCYVDETCPSDIAQVANRIVWAKLVNCGQNCISPDYLVIHKSKMDKVVPELVRTLKDQYGEDPQQSGLSKLVSPGHVTRAIEVIKDVEERAKTDKSIQILCGGSSKCNAEQGYVAPTFVLNAPMDCRMMQEELFCPILPIRVVESRDEAVTLINSVPGTPLGLYIFTSSARVFQEMTERCRAGTAVRNDSLVQFAGPHLPFGGLGSSGYGKYRGQHSLEAFTHLQPSVYRVCAPLMDMKMLRYQPFAPWKMFMLEKVVPILPDIPVFKRVTIASLLIVTGVAIAISVPSADALVRTTRAGLADLLRTAANALSP